MFRRKVQANQKNLEYHKARVLKTFPDASCFETNLFWPGQGERRAWIVTTAPHSSATFASAATEEWAWERAAINIAFGSARQALLAVDQWADGKDAPWREIVQSALALAKE